jgi:hypothetical protein
MGWICPLLELGHSKSEDEEVEEDNEDKDEA